MVPQTVPFSYTYTMSGGKELRVGAVGPQIRGKVSSSSVPLLYLVLMF